MTAFKVAYLLCLPPLHSQQVRRADHVDIEEGPPHQEVRRLGRDILGKLGQPLGGDDAGKPALAATAHQIGHGAEREFARFVRNLAGDGRRGVGAGAQVRRRHHGVV
mgnify:CR=1 FL=1